MWEFENKNLKITFEKPKIASIQDYFLNIFLYY